MAYLYLAETPGRRGEDLQHEVAGTRESVLPDSQQYSPVQHEPGEVAVARSALLADHV